jgi:hypothetical protein
MPPLRTTFDATTDRESDVEGRGITADRASRSPAGSIRSSSTASRRTAASPVDGLLGTTIIMQAKREARAVIDACTDCLARTRRLRLDRTRLTL